VFVERWREAAGESRRAPSHREPPNPPEARKENAYIGAEAAFYEFTKPVEESRIADRRKFRLEAPEYDTGESRGHHSISEFREP
jgi:hypothetical protein